MTGRHTPTLRHRHLGQSAVLIANGPSLARMDLTFLHGRTVIGLNKIFLGFKTFGFYPQYYVAVNPTVIEQSAAAIRELDCVRFLGSRGARGLFTPDALTHILNTDTPPERFCQDIAQGVHEGGTVTYAALQVAYYLGFAEIIIIGMDHRYTFAGAPNAPAVLAGPDPNHFCADYFGHGQRWDNPDLAHSEASYRLARQIYEADGRRILDATLDGACDIFEKIDWRALRPVPARP